MSSSGRRDPLDGDRTPIDPSRIGSGLVEGEGDTPGFPRSVTSRDAVDIPEVAHETTTRPATSLATPNLRADLMEQRVPQGTDDVTTHGPGYGDFEGAADTSAAPLGLAHASGTRFTGAMTNPTGDRDNPEAEGYVSGSADRDGDGILEGDEIDLSDPFDAIDGDDTQSVLGKAFEDDLRVPGAEA